MIRYLAYLLLCSLWPMAAAADDAVSRAVYIANMGAMIERGETKVVFVSHHHGDHFDPATILELLRTQETIELFGYARWLA